MDNLRRRITLVMDWCCMCKDTETFDHLLLQPTLQSNWKNLGIDVQNLNVARVMSQRFIVFLAVWRSQDVGCGSVEASRHVPSCLIWSLWMMQNV